MFLLNLNLNLTLFKSIKKINFATHVNIIIKNKIKIINVENK